MLEHDPGVQRSGVARVCGWGKRWACLLRWPLADQEELRKELGLLRAALELHFPPLHSAGSAGSRARGLLARASSRQIVAVARGLIEDYANEKIAQTQREQIYQSFLSMKHEQDRIAVYLRERYPAAIARGEHDNKSLADLVIHYLNKT